MIDISSPKFYNKLYYDLQECTKKYMISYGGRGSGKTTSSIQNEIIKIIMLDYVKEQDRIPLRTLVIRKFQSTLNATIIKEFKDMLDFFEYKDYTFNQSQYTFFFKNGSEIVFRGADNTEKLKGLKNSRIMIEEANELEQDDFTNLISMLRGIHLQNPQITILFNPVSSQHWIKKLLFDTDIYKNNTAFFHTTAKDNKFVGEDYITDLENLKYYNYNKYKVEALGEWGELNKDGCLYQSFEPENIVKHVNYNPQLPLCLSFDDNKNPYISVICFNMEIDAYGNMNYNVFDEFALENTNLEGVCKKITAKYHTHQNDMWIFGDASSKRGSSILQANENFYTMAMGYLKGFRPKLKILNSNMETSATIDYLNFIFGSQDKIKIWISPQCEELIDDLQYTKMDANGKKDKRRIRNKKTGLSQEEFGHMSDALTYAIVQSNFKDFEVFRSGGLTFKPLVSFKENPFKPNKEIIKSPFRTNTMKTPKTPKTPKPEIDFGAYFFDKNRKM